MGKVLMAEGVILSDSDDDDIGDNMELIIYLVIKKASVKTQKL